MRLSGEGFYGIFYITMEIYFEFTKINIFPLIYNIALSQKSKVKKGEKKIFFENYYNKKPATSKIADDKILKQRINH